VPTQERKGYSEERSSSDMPRLHEKFLARAAPEAVKKQQRL
jgi:hypothetical protein